MAELQIAEKTMEIIAPTLELESVDAPVAKTVAPQDAEAFRKQQFTPQELKQIEDFAEKIDFNDTSIVVTYGSGAQKRLADFSDETLRHMRNKDIDEIGPLLSNLMADLKNEPESKKGFLSNLFGKAKTEIDRTRAYYGKVEKSIDSITGALESHQQTLFKDIALADRLYENNKIYFKELTMYIAAGKLALDKAINETLPALNGKAHETGLAEDAQVAKDFSETCSRFEKKLHDLDLTRAICLQNAPQIRLVQSNAVILTDKIQSTLMNTIPLWKNQMIITMGIAHNKEAVRTQRIVTDTTNEILKKNAEMLHQGTVEVAKENERGIVDLETLQHTNQELIATIDDLMRVQEEGRVKRAQAEAELVTIENQLKQKMLEVSAR